MYRMARANADEALADREHCAGKSPLQAAPPRHLHRQQSAQPSSAGLTHERLSQPQARSIPHQAQKQPPASLGLPSPVTGAKQTGNKAAPSTNPLEGQEFPARGGHKVRFVQQAGQWRAIVLEHLGAFYRESVIPVCCQGNGDVKAVLQDLQGKPDKYVQQHIHVQLTQQSPHLVYLGEHCLKGGMQPDAGAGGSRPPPSLGFQGRSASKTLRNRMDKEDISSTEALVEAINAAQSPEDQAALQEWVRAYIEWFNREPVGNLTQQQGIDLKEYSLLAGIQADSAGQKELLRDFFDSLHRKIQKDELGKACLIEALEYTLQAMDPDVFEGDPTSMLQLGNEFFAKLDPTRIIFVKATFPTLRSTLSVLHQTLMLIQKIAPSQLNPMQENGLYSRFRARVEAIADNAEYYPVCYHARLLEQSLQCLALPGNQARFQDGLRRLRKGVKGVIFFYKGIKALATFDFDIGSFEAGYESCKAAFSSQHIKSKPWYDWHLAMQHACLLSLEGTDQYNIFIECLRGVQEKEASIRKAADRKVLRFGLVRQLCLVALEGGTAEVRKASIEKLTSMAHSCNIADRECWIKDLDILEELLEGLATIAMQGQGESEKEEAGVALEILTCSTLGDNTLLEAALQEAVTAWLGEQTLEEKLSNVPAPAAGHVSGGLFTEINGSLRLVPGEMPQAPDLGTKSDPEEHLSPASMRETCQELKAHYLHDNFVQVRSLFDGQLPKHVESIQCQLMLFEPAKDNNPQESSQGACLDDLGTHYERLKQVKTPISMEELFHDRCTQPGKPVHEIHKVLLVGNPGTGKTTLSRKLAYCWAQGTWGRAFEAVFVLPVRALQQSAYDNVSFRRDETLANAIVKNCFGPREDDDYKRLRHHISQILNKPTTLVVLDGLDERYGASEQLINQAKSGSHKLLILSRPYGIEAERSMADIEIEHVGFNHVQLEAFVNHELSPEQGSELLTFIRGQPAIRSIAHVPVNLQILCALWHWQDKGGGAGVQAVPMSGSLFGLYRRLTGYVWHRYKEKHREQHLEDQEREALFNVLGQIAVLGLECGEVLLSQGLVDRVLVEGGERVRDMLKDAGLLLLQDLGKQYQFPHLTFQEYFAGRWLGKQLMSREPRQRRNAEKFFLKHKYEHQFREAFSFLAGEVSKRQEVEEIKQLLKLAEAEPQEIIGVQHLLLQIRLLHEWLCVAGEDLEVELAHLEGEFQIFGSLKGWFQVGVEWARREREWYQQNSLELLVLLTAGMQGSRAVAANFPILLEPLLIACKDSDEKVRRAALETLGRVVEVAPGHAPTLVGPILGACKDFEMQARNAALHALVKVVKAAPEQGPFLIKAILNDCKGSEMRVCFFYAVALEKIVEAMLAQVPSLLEPLLKACKDSNKWVSDAVLSGLRKVVKAAPGEALTLIKPLLCAGKESEGEVCCVALEALGYVVEAEPAEAPTLLKPLISACRESKGRVRLIAVKTLGDVMEAAPGEAPTLLDPLLSACKDSGWEVRLFAVKALGKVVEVAPGLGLTLLEAMLSACKDSKCEVRYTAVKVLGKVVESAPEEAPILRDPILIACKDSDQQVRNAAVDALGKVVEAAPGEAHTFLEPMLIACKDKDQHVRCTALEALGKVVEAVPDEAPTMLEPLLNACKDCEWEVCDAVLETLGRVVGAAPGEAPALLEPMLSACRNSGSRFFSRPNALAMKALGKVMEAMPGEAPTLLEPMLSACENSDLLSHYALGVLQKVVEAAGRVPSMLKPLLDVCMDSHQQVRCAALEALGNVVEAAPGGAPTLLDSLLDACKDSEGEVRLFAVKVLGKVVEVAPGLGPTLLEAVLSACKDLEREVRLLAVKTLGDVMEAAPGEASTLLEPLLGACKDSDENVRCIAVRTLVKVVEAVPDEASTVIGPLFNACKDSKGGVRCISVKALGKVVEASPGESEAMFQPLLEACKDSDPKVRKAAVDALGKMVKAIPGEAPTLLKPILIACEDSDQGVRLNAVKALGKVVKAIPGESSTLLKPILIASKDSYSSVRLVALEILRHLSLQQLMDGYWATHNQACIPTIAARLYYAPLIIRSSPKLYHQRLFLYPTAGQVVKWDIPQEEVDSFLQQIQRAARQGVSERIAEKKAWWFLWKKPTK